MDRLMLGLSTTGVGMLVVFFGLVILIACIYLMTSITGRQRAAAKKEMTLQKAPMPAPIPAAPAAEARDSGCEQPSRQHEKHADDEQPEKKRSERQEHHETASFSFLIDSSYVGFSSRACLR